MEVKNNYRLLSTYRRHLHWFHQCWWHQMTRLWQPLCWAHTRVRQSRQILEQCTPSDPRSEWCLCGTVALSVTPSWQLTVDSWQSTLDSWQSTLDSRQLTVGSSWPLNWLTVNTWHLTVGSWWPLNWLTVNTWHLTVGSWWPLNCIFTQIVTHSPAPSIRGLVIAAESMGCTV